MSIYRTITAGFPFFKASDLSSKQLKFILLLEPSSTGSLLSSQTYSVKLRVDTGGHSNSLFKHKFNMICPSTYCHQQWLILLCELLHSPVPTIVSERWFLKLQCCSSVTAISVSGRNLYFFKELLRTQREAQSKLSFRS